jgi:hypothetical protein
MDSRIGVTCRQRYNDVANGVDRDVRSRREADSRRYAVDVNLSGPEIHALRGLVEEAIVNLDKKIRGATDQTTNEALKESKDVFRHIMDKLPVEFGTLS